MKLTLFRKPLLQMQKVLAVQFKIPYTVLQRNTKNPTSVKKQGGQTVLTPIEKDTIVKKLQVCAEWGYPLDLHGLRLIIKLYLDRLGKTVARFKNNMPGKDFSYGFMKRHKSKLAVRLCQNIKRARAGVSPVAINEYFDNLEGTLRNILASHRINYDETNLSNDPGRSKIIAKRGCKYPERVFNQTKSAVSIMFAATGDGKMLPCYVVYKAKHIYSTWVEGGPKYTRYNATLSGWFDNMTFTDWLKAVVIPYLQRLDGDKVLIGDNLSKLSPMQKKNIKAGFCKAGLVPINRDKVLSIPKVDENKDAEIVNVDNNLEASFCDLLKQMRYGDNGLKRKKSGKKN
ncbi:hypothetical protein NQ314_019121 [Rhamnusium bicolor]|uniref:DDE-1 domain-containing protein n=1 Tax=Rhamnusium bicolor TaxID=1586634 RepID=A0AAV8WPF4_9CUCU|nr:hypothetical protein NQ314_019121 [Rhamnusium bicolor]